jgi:glycine reductase
MYGYGSEISKYGNLNHICIAPSAADNTAERDFEDAIKIAGFKTAVYLAQAAEQHPIDEVEIYDMDFSNIENKSGLPRIAYFYQMYSPQHDHRGVSDSCFYGTDVRNLVPTIIHPNEVLDGGVVGPHTIRSIDTYTIQNHALIKELYRRHGVDLIFVGVVIGVANMEPITRARNAMIASNLIKNILCADGVVISKIHGGMPHVDVALVAEECEKNGVRTAVYDTPLVSVGPLSETLLFNNKASDLREN